MVENENLQQVSKDTREHQQRHENMLQSSVSSKQKEEQHFP